MSVLTGVLVDVSRSMERSVGGKVEEEGGSWARSIFKVVDDLLTNDVTESNRAFALGVGASGQPEVFDLLNTLKKARRSSKPSCSGRSHQNILENALSILERNGAPRVRTWAKMHVLCSNVSYDDAAAILDKLQHDPEFTKRFVYDCLPEDCRKVTSYAKEGFNVAINAIGFFGIERAARGTQEFATADSIREAVRRGKELMMCEGLVSVDGTAVVKVREACEILHGCVGESELTDERVDELMEAVRPFIFGGTPLMKALDQARGLFAARQHKDHHKLLFVLSDGQPTDGDNPPLKALSDLGVRVVSCFITDRSISDPFRLYSREESSWQRPAKFMFRMSSTIKTEWIPRTVFVKRGWKIDVEDNETRLFCQVNHPDVIKDVCDLARNVVCCQDALADILASVSLDVYINQTKERFGAKEQERGTCYANACAAVLHLAMKRIVGRVGDYPDFFEIRDKLIDRYGWDGAYVREVLRETCPKYRLRFEKVDVLGAMAAVTAKRPVIALFWLTDKNPIHPGNPYEWKSFSDFYRHNPRGILTKSEVDISKRPPGAKLGGHAVVLTSYDSKSLRFMNSWGSDWADGGFFRVQNASVLGLEFVDVFWTLDDLRQEEKDAYARHGPEMAKKLLSTLRGLQNAKYRCPLCLVESKLDDFSGHIQEVKCRKCGGTFSTKVAGDDLVLNMYLTSLSR